MLSVGFAGALLAGGEREGVEARLRDAERWLDTTTGLRQGSQAPPAEMVVVDGEEYRRLPAEIELYRAALALARGDGPGTVRHARRALELSPADEHLGRASAAALMGLASWASGDLEAGHSGYAECMAGLRRAGHIADTFGCAIALADIRRTQGRLGEAMRTYEQALQRAYPAGRGGSAGHGRHVRGDERGPPRARRLACRHAAIAAEPGAGGAHRVAAEPVSLAGRDGADTPG